MELVTIGKILNTVGLRGEVKVFVITDFPSKRFKKGQRVFLSLKIRKSILKPSSQLLEKAKTAIY
jgi:16S rRNA processing protein RimM